MFSPELAEQLRRAGVEAPAPNSVLLVDDDPANLDVLSAALEDDYEVLLANNGAEALTVAMGEGGVDLVISDQRMPGLSGVELLEQVAQRWPNTVRVLLTAYTDVAPMIEAINRGAVHRFLLKPFDMDEMLAVVADGLAEKAAGDALKLVVAALAGRRVALREALEEQQRAEAQLLAAERVAALGRVSSGIIHDLRNQMAIVSAIFDIVRASGGSASLQRAADRAWQELDAYRHLVQQVRDYARAQAQTPAAAPIDTEEFVHETVAMHSMDPAGQRCQVDVTVAPGARRLALDRARMRQALLALLRNAAQATPPGEPVSLVAAVAPDGTGLIEVRDRGHGMPPEVLERAPEPFFSGFDPPRLGLGLEIARLGAAAHGGTLELEPRPGGGTVARISLGEETVQGATP